MGEVLPQLAGGKIRVLATTGPKRNRFLPDVPTLLESGVKDGVVEFWGGLFVPAKTPPAVVAKPAEYVDEAFQAQDMKDYYARASREIVHKNPAEFASLIKSDMDRWKALVQASGFTAEE